jgi:hypothetical protein
VTGAGLDRVTSPGPVAADHVVHRDSAVFKHRAPLEHDSDSRSPPPAAKLGF